MRLFVGVLVSAFVKALGAADERRRRRKNKKKTKMTILDFHRFQVRHFSISSNLLATVRWGNAREQI